MTNGEKMQEIFPEGETRRCRNGVVFESDGWCHAYDSDWWNAEYKEPTTNNAPIDYCRAFKIACDLLNGAVLYGVDSDEIFKTMMDRDGVVTKDSYEEYILNHLQELDHGEYANMGESET